MPTFNNLKGDAEQRDYSVPYEYQTEANRTNLLLKVFLVLFVSLLLTAGASYGIGYWLSGALDMRDEIAFNGMMIAMGVSVVGLVIMSIVIPVAMSRGKHSILPYYILYLVFMSVLLSTLFVIYDMSIIVISFGITGVVFGVMALLGYLSKGSLNGLGLLGTTFFLGAIGLSLINFFMRSQLLYWIISFGVFAYILFITAYDVRRIKDIINSGCVNNSNNLVLFCALTLYMDFVNILIRIAAYLAKAKSND